MVHINAENCRDSAAWSQRNIADLIKWESIQRKSIKRALRAYLLYEP